MTTFDSYANGHIGFYEARFQNETNEQLANDFSALATSRGWTDERSYYSAALTHELQRRGVDLTGLVNNEDGQQTIRYVRVVYDEASHALLPIE